MSDPAPEQPQEPKQESPQEEPPQEEPPQEEPKQEEPKDQQDEEENVIVEPKSNPEAEYVKKSSGYVQDIAADYEMIEKWHTSFIQFLSARRAPLLLQLKELHMTLNDGQMGLKQTLGLLDGFIVKYKTLQTSVVNDTQLYNRPLKTTPENLPIITTSGQGDPSILSLAALVSHLYDTSTDYAILLEKLKAAKEELLPFVREPSFKNSFKVIKALQVAETDADKKLVLYRHAVEQFKINQSDFTVLTNKKRNNMNQTRAGYVRAILTLWKAQASLKIVREEMNIEIEPDKQRQVHVTSVLMRITDMLINVNLTFNTKLQATLLKQQYAPTQAATYHQHQAPTRRASTTEGPKNAPVQQTQPDHRHEHFVRVNPTLPSPIPPILTKSSTIKLFVDVPEDATRAQLEKIASETAIPSDFPEDPTILKSDSSAKRYGLISDKSADLVYTKNHLLQLHLHSDNEKAIENVPGGDGAPKVNLLAEPDWTLDGAVLFAIKHEKKDDVVIFQEKKKGLFSFNGKQSVVFGSSTEADEWIQFINDNNSLFE